MPFWIITIGLPVRKAAAGVKAWSLETTTSGISSPRADSPKELTCISGVCKSSNSR